MALSSTVKRLLERLRKAPAALGRKLGFTLLTDDLHNQWIIEMVWGKGDTTLQAHRGSYKTTCVALALALIIILHPNDKTLFCRKTNDDVVEIIAQVKKILLSPITQTIVMMIYGVELKLTKDTSTELSTNLGENDPRGTSQLLGLGTKASVTGKHYDRIFTDDIVNKEDRASRAEREKTKTFYQELLNVVNRGGRIFNTGTPWHKEDAFEVMPNPTRYDCYTTGLITEEKIAELKGKMTSSLFAANYELKHIANDQVLFKSPVTGASVHLVEQGESHIDASYGGEDGSAFTIVKKKEGKYYVLGKLRHQHIDDCEDEFIQYHNMFMARTLSCETNGDKGYLAKEIRKKGVRVTPYHEKANKYTKIASWLKAVWNDVVFVEGTDKEYIEQICDYNIDAEHDDAPDSLASLIRKLWKKGDTPDELESYLEFI